MEELEDIGWEAQNQVLAEEQEVSKRPKKYGLKKQFFFFNFIPS